MATWEPLERRVRTLIEQRDAPIPFPEFMHHALYMLPTPQGEGGFYAGGKVKFGPGGDFFTSPEMYSPEYGQGFARLLADEWETLGRPAPFTVVEMGGGDGVLARDIVTAVQETYPEFARAMRYVLLEISPLLVKRQRRTAEGLPIEWIHGSATALPLSNLTGCVISNELPDAFPFHRMIWSDDRLLEIYVGVEEDDFYETALDPSTPEAEALARAWEPRVPEGVEFSVSPLADAWMAQVGDALTQGCVVTIDYGYAERATVRERGVPARYFGQQHQVGAFDITTDVDFEQLIATGRAHGLELVTLADEVDFTAGWTHHEMGIRGKAGRARYVLIQRAAQG